MSKRVLAVVLLAILAVSLGVSAVAAQDDIVVTWRTRPDNQAEIDVYTALSESIDARLDGISLQYQAGGTETSGYESTLLTEVAAGTAPDIFWIPGTNVATFAGWNAAEGAFGEAAIANLAELAAADANFSADNFVAAQMAPLTFDPTAMASDASTTLWGLPRDASSFALYVNLDLFEEAGIPTPAELLAEGNWNWETFTETVIAIGELGDDIAGFGLNAWWANWWLFMNAAGGGYFSEDTTQCALNSEENLAAMQFLTELYGSGETVPFGTDSEPPYLAGNVGMFMNGRWATPNALNAEFNWDYAEVPAGPAGQSNWLFWGAYVVNANSVQDPDRAAAVWQVLSELTSVESQSTTAALGASMPSRVGDSAQPAVDAFLASVPGKNNEAFINALGYGVAEAPLWTGPWGEIDAIVSAEVTKVINGETTPEEFQASICDQVNPLLSGGM